MKMTWMRNLFTGLALMGLAVSAAQADQPPVTGDMANFTAHSAPKAAPDIEFVGENDQQLKLSDFAGKTVLINFWATWCGPCRHEMKDLDALQAALGDEGLQVLPISADRQGLSVVDKFYADEGLKHLGKYNDKSNKSNRAFRALGLPTTVLINAAGEEVGRLVGPAAWGGEDAVNLMRYYMRGASG